MGLVGTVAPLLEDEEPSEPSDSVIACSSNG